MTAPSKSTLAKIIAWVSGALAILAANNSFGKFSPVIAQAAPLITAASVHLASNTSAGHPNG